MTQVELDFGDIRFTNAYQRARVWEYILSVNQSLSEGEKWPEDINYLLSGNDDEYYQPLVDLPSLMDSAAHIAGGTFYSTNEWNKRFSNAMQFPHKAFIETQLQIAMRYNANLINTLGTRNPKNTFSAFECMRNTTSSKDANTIENSFSDLCSYLLHILNQLDFKIRFRIPGIEKAMNLTGISRIPVNLYGTKHLRVTLSTLNAKIGERIRSCFSIAEDDTYSSQTAIEWTDSSAYSYIDVNDNIRIWFTSNRIHWSILQGINTIWLPICHPVIVPAINDIVYITRRIDPYSTELIEPVRIAPDEIDAMMHMGEYLASATMIMSLIGRIIPGNQGMKRSTWSSSIPNTNMRKVILACADHDETF